MPDAWLYPVPSDANPNDGRLRDPTVLAAPPASITVNSTVALPFNGLGAWLTEALGQEWLTEVTGEPWLVETSGLAVFDVSSPSATFQPAWAGASVMAGSMVSAGA